MANIGEFKKNANGFYMGSIVTLAVSMTLALREVNNPNPNAPRYEVYAKSVAGAWVKVGALWERIGGETGEAFLNGQIDDPSMDRTLYIACFMQRDGSYAITWSRPRRARSAPPAALHQGSGDQDGDDRVDQDAFPFDGSADGATAKGKAKGKVTTTADLGASTSDIDDEVIV